MYDLSPRQKQIARLAGSGLRHAEIAEQLNIGVRTVKNQLHIVYQVLRQKGQLDLIVDLNLPLNSPLRKESYV